MKIRQFLLGRFIDRKLAGTLAESLCYLGLVLGLSAFGVANANVPANSDLYIFTVDTSIVDDTASGSFRLPVAASNYQLYWEEVGNESGNNSAGVVHIQNALEVLTFPSAGIYRIGIDPVGVPSGVNDFSSFVFDDQGDDDKLLTIQQWGTTEWSDMERAYYGASQLTEISAQDVPDLSQIIDMQRTFANTTLLTNINNISNWDTSSVTDMNCLFCFAPLLNPDVENWDTSSVTTFRQMFRAADIATPNLANWDTSAVTDMSMMFYDALLANPNTSGWDTSSVTTMSQMFRDAPLANPNTSGWDTAAVTDMSGLFLNAASASPDVGTWNTSLVTDFGSMFENAVAASPDTSTWNTASATDMKAMFEGAILATPVTDNWDTTLVTDMSEMFNDAAFATPNTSNWNTAAVTNMGSMFLGATAANPDVSGWDVSNVTNMNNMFNRASSANPDTSLWDTSSVTSMSSMFKDAPNANPDTTNWNTALVTSMASMFEGATLANPNTSNWDTSSVTSMASMFENAVIAAPNTVAWDTANVTTMEYMFFGAVQAAPLTMSWDTSAVTSMRDMFNGAVLANPDTLTWDTSEVINMTRMFSGASVANPRTAGWNTAKVNDMSYMFNGAEIANPDTSGWDTAAVTRFTGMFNGASLASPDTSNWSTSAATALDSMFSMAVRADPDTSAWDTSSVTLMNNMFEGAVVAQPDTRNWDTSAVTTMEAMFNGASLANPNTANWNTSSVTNFSEMFQFAVIADPDTSAWDTSSVTDMGYVFRGASLANPDVSNWDVSSVTRFSRMFSETKRADPDVSNWDMSSVNVMTSMFLDAHAADPDVSNWDISSVTSIAAVFTRAVSANPDVSNWDTSNVVSFNNVFNGATSATPDVSNWDTSSGENFRGTFKSMPLGNPDVSQWDTSSATDMGLMFSNSPLANPDISGFDTSNVTSMENMFYLATSFDRNLSVFDMSSVTTVRNMLTGVTLSKENYDALLSAWSSQQLQPGLEFHAGNSRYCDAADSREAIAVARQWIIFDGGLDCSEPILQKILENSDSTDGGGNAGEVAVTVEELLSVRDIDHVVANNILRYQQLFAIETNFSNPPTAEEIQSILDLVNGEVAFDIINLSSQIGGDANISSLTSELLASVPDIKQVLPEFEANYQSNILAEASLGNIVDTVALQELVDYTNMVSAPLAVLEDSASPAGSSNADGIPITNAILNVIPGLENIAGDFESDYQAAIANESNFASPPTVAEIQTVINTVNESRVMSSVLEDSVSTGGNGNLDGVAVSTYELSIIPFIDRVVSEYGADYRAMIAAESGFSNPPTRLEVQNIIDSVNDRNILAAILEDSVSPGGFANIDSNPVSAIELAAMPGVNFVITRHEAAYQEVIAAESDFENPPTVSQIQELINAVNSSVLVRAVAEDSASTSGSFNADGVSVTSEELVSILGMMNVFDDNEHLYQAAIAAETGFSDPPTQSEIQAIVDSVNASQTSLEAIAAAPESATVTMMNQVDGLTDVDQQFEVAYQNVLSQSNMFRDLPTLSRLQAVVLSVNEIMIGGQDRDQDGIVNRVEAGFDTDNDGITDDLDVDSDNDGLTDAIEGEGDLDSDGIPNFRDLDSDNDTIFDLMESTRGAADYVWMDQDLNGVIDATFILGTNGYADLLERIADSGIANFSPSDSDFDALSDFLDLDSDNDGLSDEIEARFAMVLRLGTISIGAGFMPANSTTSFSDGTSALPLDSDSDGAEDYRDRDSDNDGLMDTVEAFGTSIDQDYDGVLDNFVDLNGNGLADTLETSPLRALDTDNDGSPDHIDVDSDGDGVSDVIESGGSDLDGDGVLDGWSDENGDGIDDDLGAFPVTLLDTDNDGIPDFRDLDSDGDGVSDLVESGAVDADGNGIADALVPGIDLTFIVGNPDANTTSESTGSTESPEIGQASSLQVGPGSSSGCSIGSDRGKGVDPMFILLVFFAFSLLNCRRLKLRQN